MGDVPVILICYNRPRHTAQVLKALSEHNAQNLYVFSDAPKTEEDFDAVLTTRKLFKSIRWTKPKIIERTENLGLARNIVSAVDYVFEKYDRLILLEDDCVPQRYFFDFVHTCLEKYENNQRVFGISGYTVQIPDKILSDYPFDLYFCPRIGSWGWATWKRAWAHHEKDLYKLIRIANEKNIDLSRAGSDIPTFIESFLKGQLKDVWTLNWVLSVYINNGVYIYPTRTHISNIGTDGTGAHCGKTDKYHSFSCDTRPTRYPADVFLDEQVMENFKSYYRAVPERSRRAVHFLRSRGPKKSLKIAQISTVDRKGGAAKVAWMLKEGLKARGLGTQMFVGQKFSNDPDVKIITDSILDSNTYYKEQGFLYYDINSTFKLSFQKEFLESDVAHLHNLHGNYFNPFALSALTESKPSIWTLHDMQSMTGHCAYSFDCEKWQTGCGNCPHLEAYPSINRDRTAEMWHDKKLIYKESDFELIVPSQWLKNIVEKSILKDKRVHLIYNGIDESIYRPLDKHAIRKMFKIPPNAVIISFVAQGGLIDKRKGGNFILEAYRYFTAKYPNVFFICVGDTSDKAPTERFLQIPFVLDEEKLVQLYCASDIFLFPTLADNCPLVILEVMGCGVPIVSFNTGGIPELIDHGQTGLIAGFKNSEEFIKMTEYLVADKAKREEFSAAGRERLLKTFTLDQMVDKHITLYERLAEQGKKENYVLPKNKVSLPAAICDNKHKYLVSAIVSTYNSEKFIRGCLEDLENQTIADQLEIIVVNSGSRENEEAIVHEYQQKHNNIVYIKTEQREGIYTAWNRAIKIARGKFITNANTDDRHRSDAFEILSSDLEKHPDISLVYADCYVSSIPNETYNENSKRHIYRYPDFLAVAAVLHDQFGPQPLWRKKTHETIGYFDGSYKAAGDHDFNIRFALHFKALHIAESLGLYLEHPGAISFRDDTLSQEQGRIAFTYRNAAIIEGLYKQVGIACDSPEEKARIHLDMGIRAMEYYPPWKTGKPECSLEFALKCFQRAVKLKPDWAAAHNNFAVVLGLGGNFQDAAKLLEQLSRRIQEPTINYNFKLISEVSLSRSAWSDAKLIPSGLSLPSQRDLSLKQKWSEPPVESLIPLQPKGSSKSGNLKILFYFDRIGNLNESSPAGTVIAVLNFARALLRNKPQTSIHLTGDLVRYPEQYESFQVIPLPPPGQREQFLVDYDVVFFATHIRYFKGLAKPPGQIWVLWQHCWEANDRVSLSHISDFDIVICLSELHRASLRDQSIGNEKLINIPNLIDTDLYSPKALSRNNHSIMFAGGLNPHKCIHILLDAFRLVRQQVKDAELHIYGDGKMWRGGDAYGNELKSIKPEGTYFHGYVDNKDMPQIYSKNSILCLPSKLESFGLVTVEAQACGCVPVVHNVGGVAATLADGQTGLLYSPNTPEKLAETIIKAIKIVDADPSVRQKAINFVRNTFSINRAAEYISKLWDKINIAKKVNTIRTLLKDNEIEEADLKCKELLQEYPNDPDVLLSQALVMLQKGNKPKANVAIGKLLDNFPNHLRALNDFGLTAMKAGDTEKALRYITKAYKFNPWDKDTITNCYAMLTTSGKYRDAKMLLLNYLTNVGEDAQILLLFREIDNLIANAGSGTKVVSQEVLNNRQDVYCGSSTSMPLVSIITPVYNGADYIGQTIESVLAQDYPNFELVIINDGSTDSTKEVISRYEDQRIRYFYQENAGMSNALNHAVRQARGQYIMPLDADDMMTADFIAAHLAEFEKHPDVDLVYCDVLLIDENSKPIRIMNKPEYQDRRHLIRDLFRAGHPVVPFRLGIKRTVYDKIGLYDEKLKVGMDYDMMRRFVKVGLKEHHLSEPLHLRRMHADSLSGNQSAQKAKCHFEVIKRFIDTFAYDELFPDVAWDEIAPQMRQLHAKCLAAGTYLAIGQDYVKTKATECSRTAFDLACSELNDCVKMEPGNQDLRQLLQKSKLIQARYTEAPQQVVSK